MRVKLLGIKETSGTFEGKPFHSVKLHIAEPFTAENSYGEETSVQSLKYDRLPFIFGKPIEVREIADFIGTTIDVSYNKNGGIDKVDLEAL